MHGRSAAYAADLFSGDIMEHYNALSPYLKNRFGWKICKLSLSARCTCPNRDGTLGTR